MLLQWTPQVAAIRDSAMLAIFSMEPNILIWISCKEKRRRRQSKSRIPDRFARQWLSERRKLLAREKELTRHYDRVNAERRGCRW